MKILLMWALAVMMLGAGNPDTATEEIPKPVPYQILRKLEKNKDMEKFELIGSTERTTNDAVGSKLNISIVHALSMLISIINTGRGPLAVSIWYYGLFIVFAGASVGKEYNLNKDMPKEYKKESRNPIVVFDSAGRYAQAKEVKIRAISLSSVHPCNDISKSYEEPTVANVQVLHIPSTTAIKVIQCKIYYTVYTQHCQNNIFISSLFPRELYIKNQMIGLTSEECKKFFLKKSISIFLFKEALLLESASKHETHIEKTLHGRAYSKKQGDGGCEGVSFTLGNEVRVSTVLSVQVSYSVRERNGLYDSKTNMVRVEPDLIEFPLENSGISCDKELGCFQSRLDRIPRSRCQRVQQGFLGNGTFYKPKMIGSDDSLAREVIQIQGMDVSQSITLIIESIDRICGHKVFRTSVPGVYVNTITTEDDKISHSLMHNGTHTSQIESVHLDLLSSMNTATIKTALQNTKKFDQISIEICEQRRNTLINSIRDILVSDTAQLLNLKRGLVFKRVGGIAYLYAGPAILANVRVTQKCYTDIPVEFISNGTNVKVFATSNGRILIENSTEVSCDQEIPIHFLPYLDEDMDLETETQNSVLSLVDNTPTTLIGRWICQTEGRFYQCPPPEVLNPSSAKALRFNGITGDMLMGSIFGNTGRERLFRIQTNSYRNKIVNEKLGDLLSDANTNLGIAMITSITTEGEAMLREKLYPTLYWLIGDTLHSFEHFVLVTLCVSMVINIICLVFRVKNLLIRYGISVKLLIGLVEQVYIAILPLANKRNDLEEQIETLKNKIEYIEARVGSFTEESHTNRLRELDFGIEGNRREIMSLGMRVLTLETNLGEFTWNRYKELRFKLDALIIGQLNPPRLLGDGNDKVSKPFERLFGLGEDNEEQDYEEFNPGNDKSMDTTRKDK